MPRKNKTNSDSDSSSRDTREIDIKPSSLSRKFKSPLASNNMPKLEDLLGKTVERHRDDTQGDTNGE